MRDFRDAKLMAQALRAHLAESGVKITISQSLELIAKAFGVADWNTLSATIQAASKPDIPSVLATPERVGFSPDLEASLHRAVDHARQRNHAQTTLEHLLLALIDDSDAAPVLTACAVNVEVLRQALVDDLDHEPPSGDGDPRPSADFQRVIQRAVIHVQASGRPTVTGANLLVAFFSEVESRAVRHLQAQNMTRIDAVNFIAHGVAKHGGGAAA